MSHNGPDSPKDCAALGTTKPVQMRKNIACTIKLSQKVKCMQTAHKLHRHS